MAKYHINSKGEPGVCRAKHACPFGSAEEHYDSREKAREAYERGQKSAPAGISKPAPRPSRMDPGRSYVLIDVTSGTILSDNTVVIETDGVDEDTLYDEPHEALATSRNEYIKEVKDVGSYRKPMALEVETGTVVSLDRLSAVSTTDFEEEDMDEAYSSDYAARGVANRHGQLAFAPPPPPAGFEAFPEGKTTYKNTVIAHAQGPSDENMAGFKTCYLLVPNAGNLTDRKRMEIGRQAWTFAGKDEDQWDNAPDEQKLAWTRTHMGRYAEAEVEHVNGDVSVITPARLMSGYNSQTFALGKIT